MTSLRHDHSSLHCGLVEGEASGQRPLQAAYEPRRACLRCDRLVHLERVAGGVVRAGGVAQVIDPLDIFVISGVGIDTIVKVPSLDLTRVDSMFVPPIQRYIGHTGNGVALGCMALGLRTAFVDMIGNADL